MVNIPSNNQTAISSAEVNSLSGEKAQANYFNTGMCPVVGVCAHGPNADQLQKFSQKTYTEHGWTPGDLLAGPLNEEGTENIKMDYLAEQEQPMYMNDASSAPFTNDASSAPFTNDASNLFKKSQKKQVKQIKISNSDTDNKIKELEERIAYLEYITNNMKSQLADFVSY